MKQLTFCLFILVTAVNLFAQDRAFPDYRSKKETFLRMQEKDIRADLASFTMGGMDESIGKGKLFDIPATEYSNNSITFSGNNIKVIVTAGIFDISKHKIQYYDKHVVKIDAKPFFGHHGELPRTTIDKVIVMLDGDTINVPTTAYSDLYDPSFTYRDASGSVKTYNSIYLSPDKHKVYIYLLNRDANYEVTWVIVDKKYFRRVVDFGFLK